MATSREGAVLCAEAQPGKTITATGSPTLVRSLLQQDLLDELILMLHPVVAGKGKQLFPAGSGDLKRLQLVRHKMTRQKVRGRLIAA